MSSDSKAPPSPPKASSAGVFFALLAYGAWGVVPMFWKLLGDVPATQILAHRVAWSLVFVVGFLAVTQRLGAAQDILRSGRVMKLLLLSSALIAVNWGIFIWAVMANRLVDASLGYFINPLVSVGLGVVLLREKLRPAQWVAVGLGALGLLLMFFARGGGLAVALTLAGTFAAYGLVRKLAPVDAVVGLFVETLFCAPFAIAYLAFSEVRGVGVFGALNPWLLLLVVLSGPITAVPLASFAAAARRLPLSSLGFFQYIAPSLQFATAVLVFGEQVDGPRLVAFIVIWLALVIMSGDAVRAKWGRPAPPGAYMGDHKLGGRP